MEERNLRAYVAEMIGTFMVVFLSAGAVYVGRMGPGQPSLVAIALAYGLIYAAALAATVPISGGFLNPAVTIMLWVFKRFDGFKTLALIGVQLLGAAIAGGAICFLLPYREDVQLITHLGTPHLRLEAFNANALGLVVLMKGIGIEFVLTMLLVFVIFATVLDPRAPRWLGSWGSRLAALWIGLTLVAETFAAFPLTGAAVNPARWFGTVIWDAIQQPGAMRDHSVYWIGPIAGALVGGWIYQAVVLPTATEQQTTPSQALRPGATAVVGGPRRK
jgi:aquaporin Z